MKVSRAIDFHLEYHQANWKKNTVKTSEFVLSKFTERFCDREPSQYITGGTTGFPFEPDQRQHFGKEAV